MIKKQVRGNQGDTQERLPNKGFLCLRLHQVSRGPVPIDIWLRKTDIQAVISEDCDKSSNRHFCLLIVYSQVNFRFIIYISKYIFQNGAKALDK